MDGATSDGGDGPASADGATTAGMCGPTQAFDTVTEVAGLNYFPSGVTEVTYSDDERTAYFGVAPAFSLFSDFAMAERRSRSDPFGVATFIYHGPGEDNSPRLSADGLTMYFASNPDGPFKIYRATRSSVTRPFGNAQPVAELNGDESSHPMLSADGETLYYDTYLLGTSDVWQMTKKGGTFMGAPAATASNAKNEYGPVVTRDELALYFVWTIPPRTDPEVRVATRTSKQAAFVDQGVVAIPAPGLQFTVPTWISPDNCRLYFRMFDQNWRSGAYVAERKPAAPSR
jgi:hypothetical protein